MKHRIVTAAQMKEIERAGDVHGLPYLQMMENAGLAAYAELHPVGPAKSALQWPRQAAAPAAYCGRPASKPADRYTQNTAMASRPPMRVPKKTHKKLQPSGPDARTSGAGLQLFAFYNFYSPIGIVWQNQSAIVLRVLAKNFFTGQAASRASCSRSVPAGKLRMTV